ncbi:MAG TPA: type II toxin-antitoxin system VapC family toxin [Stellaceae bacterium]|nr:type II toxin-antitoxin system VapC family toxin [Stellaceae bacterium]
MRLLLDTHVFVWWDDESPALARALREVIADPGNEIYVSAASVWEIAIKRRRGKIAFLGGIKETVLRNRFRNLPITPDHAEHAGGLPLHHRDPFDRMLIAQTVLESMALGTQDEMMRPYGVLTIGLPPGGGAAG